LSDEVSDSFVDQDDFGTEGDLRRIGLLEEAVMKFFGPRRATFARAFDGHSVAHTLITVEMLAFQSSLMCAALEKSVLPLLEQMPEHQRMAAALRAQLENIIDAGRSRATHHEAQQLLRGAMIACMIDMQAEEDGRASASVEEAPPGTA
jgi:hypothetical protein